MTGKIMPLRERGTSTIQAAADAFLSSPRYANPNTRRGYTGVLDRRRAARFIELSGQMASREQAGMEQDEAGQALRSLGVTPSAENRLQAALGRSAGRHVLAVRPGCPGSGQRRARTPPSRWRWPRRAAGRSRCTPRRNARGCPAVSASPGEHPAHLGLTRATADSIASGTPDAHRAALASLVGLPPAVIPAACVTGARLRSSGTG